MNDITEKTHYRKAFKSPYLSSADIVEPTVLTIKHVLLELDKTNKTKEFHNTAYFDKEEIRPGEELKPMILNVINCEFIKNMTGSKFINDWNNLTITIYVDPNVKYGRDTVEGLRIRDAILISEDQLEQLSSLMKEVEADQDKFLKHFGIATLSFLPAMKYTSALSALKKKKKIQETQDDSV